jgi:hypothetical protein
LNLEKVEISPRTKPSSKYPTSKENMAHSTSSQHNHNTQPANQPNMSCYDEAMNEEEEWVPPSQWKVTPATWMCCCNPQSLVPVWSAMSPSTSKCVEDCFLHGYDKVEYEEDGVHHIATLERMEQKGKRSPCRLYRRCCNDADVSGPTLTLEGGNIRLSPQDTAFLRLAYDIGRVYITLHVCNGMEVSTYFVNLLKLGFSEFTDEIFIR